MNHLALVPSGEIPADAPSYSEALARLAELEASPDYRIRDLEDLNAGLRATVDKQARAIGVLERKLSADDPEQHPQRAEINALIERWKERLGHPKAKASKDRFDLIKARLKDGYTVEQIELAIDGLAAFPYVVNAQRSATGKDSQRYDQLKHCLKGGMELERFANLGFQARRAA